MSYEYATLLKKNLTLEEQNAKLKKLVASLRQALTKCQKQNARQWRESQDYLQYDDEDDRR